MKARKYAKGGGPTDPKKTKVEGHWVTDENGKRTWWKDPSARIPMADMSHVKSFDKFRTPAGSRATASTTKVPVPIVKGLTTNTGSRYNMGKLLPPTPVGTQGGRGERYDRDRRFENGGKVYAAGGGPTDPIKKLKSKGLAPLPAPKTKGDVSRVIQRPKPDEVFVDRSMMDQTGRNLNQFPYENTKDVTSNQIGYAEKKEKVAPGTYVSRYKDAPKAQRKLKGLSRSLDRAGRAANVVARELSDRDRRSQMGVGSARNRASVKNPLKLAGAIVRGQLATSAANRKLKRMGSDQRLPKLFYNPRYQFQQRPGGTVDLNKLPALHPFKGKKAPKPGFVGENFYEGRTGRADGNRPGSYVPNKYVGRKKGRTGGFDQQYTESLATRGPKKTKFKDMK